MGGLISDPGASWDRIESGFASDLTATRRLLVDVGSGDTVTTTCPGDRWRGHVLEIDGPADRDLDPRGRGLDLLPSAIWTGGPLSPPIRANR